MTGEEIVYVETKKKGKVILSGSEKKFQRLKLFGEHLDQFPYQLNVLNENENNSLFSITLETSSNGHAIIIYNETLLEKIQDSALFIEDVFPLQKFVKDLNKFVSVLIRKGEKVIVLMYDI